MYDTTLHDDVYVRAVTDRSDIANFIREIYCDSDDDACDHYGMLPTVNNTDLMPQTFPCMLGVRWAGAGTVDVVFSFDIRDLSNMTHELVKAGALLGNKI